jgi:hypothetical protein
LVVPLSGATSDGKPSLSSTAEVLEECDDEFATVIAKLVAS